MGRKGKFARVVLKINWKNLSDRALDVPDTATTAVTLLNNVFFELLKIGKFSRIS